MRERSGLVKDHKPVNGMYSEADYKELLALAQRNEGRVCSLSVTARELKNRLADLDRIRARLAEAEAQLGLAVGTLSKIIGKPPESPALLAREIRELVRETLAKLEKK